MANANNEIGGIVKKCKILLLDIEGTTTSISFVKDKLFPYAEEKVKQFLESKWDEEVVKEVVGDLRKLALEDKENNVEGVVSIPGEDATKEEQIEGVVSSVKWLMSADRKVGPLKLLQGHIWKEGYDNGDIKGHVYDDVSPALEQWRSTEGQKVYIYSSGSEQAQKLLFKQSVAGDLLPMIDGHFDTAIGGKQEAASYVAIAEKIGSKPEEILFLTDIVKEAEAARESGLYAALVSREGNAPLPDEATAAYPVLHSFAQLTVSNKRKTDPQDEQPAKVAKTDVGDDVKASEIEETPKVSEIETPKEAPEPETQREAKEAETVAELEVPSTTTTEEAEKPETMDVEEAAPPVQEVNKQSDEKMDESPETKTVVEEITDSNDAGDVPVSNVDPIIVENIEKAEEKETEKMDTDGSEITTSIEPTAEVKNGEQIADEKTTAVITEIEEITDKPLPEVAEIIDDLVPVIEEPTTSEEIEELQSVGEVLEKECDEILSKVQDVTNLDNIPLKPLLNPIAEETMETDNVDSNDIVDRILDTELEMEIKQCADIDLSTVSEMTETKTDTISENSLDEKSSTTTNNVPEEKNSPSVDTVEMNIVTEKEIVENMVTEKETVETSMAKEKESVETNIVTEKEETKIVENMVTEKETVETSMAKEKESVETNIVTEKEETNIVTEKENAEMNIVTEKETVENNVSENKAESSPTELAESIPVLETTPETKLEESKPAETETEQTLSVESYKEIPEAQTETSVNPVVEVTAEAKVNETVSEPANVEEVKEPQVNGKTTNGDTDTVNLNGDASKTEELNARLSVENGKEEVNGANGVSAEAEQGQGDNKIETEVSDIKVKTVAVEEPRTDPIDQPTEA